MTKIRVLRHAQRDNPIPLPPPVSLLAARARRGGPSGAPIADQLPRRAAAEQTGELVQFPRRDPDPPPLVA
jgi:hypothetical protein